LEEKEAELKKEMTSLKERNHSLEQMVNELLSKGDGYKFLLCKVSFDLDKPLHSVGVQQVKAFY